MSKDPRLKITDSIRDALIGSNINDDLELIGQLRRFVDSLKTIEKLVSKFSKAYDNDCYLAAEKIRTQTGRDFDTLSHTVNQAKIVAQQNRPEIPDIKTIFEEIANLASEADNNLTIDYAKNTISIDTEPIELDELYLGKFCIVLNISELPKMNSLSPYSIIALDPNPAATNEDVTHPHVSCEKLCEGDGTVPIRKALSQGRLADFFTIIQSILKTYNPDSPYVDLDEWDGVACYDCGYTTNRDNIFYCELCSNDYCQECSSYCRICDETTCLGCGGECPSCGEFICKNCLTECQICKTQMCKGCIEEGDLCLECKTELEDLENIENEEQDNETCQPVVAKIQVICIISL